MLAAPVVFLFGALRDKDTREAFEAHLDTKIPCSCLSEAEGSCELCRAMCAEFVLAVISVLERDFVQLLHGNHASLFSDRVGVQFLLGGLTLGLLYESVPEAESVDELVITILTTMLSVPVWKEAVRLYGPAPKRTHGFVPKRAKTLGRRKASTVSLQGPRRGVTMDRKSVGDRPDPSVQVYH